jgi:uncharacterized protein
MVISMIVARAISCTFYSWAKRRLIGTAVMALSAWLVPTSAFSTQVAESTRASTNATTAQQATDNLAKEVAKDIAKKLSAGGNTSGTLPTASAEDKTGSAVDAATPKKSPHIALIVPSASKTFGKVADAVRMGFIAAANVEGKTAPAYRIYAAEDDTTGLANAYRQAISDGAVSVVAGVTRDGANMLVREAGSVPVLALNAPTENPLPQQFFYVSLNLDWEARLAARAVFEDGLRRVTLIATNTALARRIQESFEKEWIRLGGEVAARVGFSPEQRDAAKIRAAIDSGRRDKRSDSVFLAADPAGARVARPYIPAGIPIYATSHALDIRAGALTNIDLDNVKFLEMPWFAEKDHLAVMAYSRPSEPLSIDYERLYALGIDAWRLAQLIAQPEARRNMQPLDGVTGRLSLDGAQFVRALATVEIRDGLPQLYRAAE